MARVILVNDSPFLLEQLRDFFESHNFEIVAMGKDGNEGVKLYDEYQPDLITLDITMPNRSGIDCLTEILSSHKNAKVLIISAISDKSVLLNCLDIGAAGYIQKPLKLRDPEYCREFLDTLDMVLNPEENADS